MARIRRVKKVVEKGFRGITPSRVCPVPFKFRSFWIDGYLADAAERHISSPELKAVPVGLVYYPFRSHVTGLLT